MSDTKENRNIVARDDPWTELELGGGLSFRRLNPTAGSDARNLKTAVDCGFIIGRAHSYADSTEEENKRSKYGPYRRIIGDFIGIAPNGVEEHTATEIFLPAVAERFVSAALDSGKGPVDVRFHGIAMPDPAHEIPGYMYRVRIMLPAGHQTVGQRMAVELGLRAPPPPDVPLELPIGDQVGSDVYDPETGEVQETAAEPLEGLNGGGITPPGPKPKRAPQTLADAVAAQNPQA